MNSKKLVFPIMIILQTITIGLLCYDSFLTGKPSVCPSVRRGISELGPEVSGNADDYGLRAEDAKRIRNGPSVEVSGNADDYGLRAEDAKRIRNGPSVTRTTIASFHHVTNCLKAGPIPMEVDNLGEKLYSELQRYQSMSDEEKREFEKKLVHRIMMSEQMKEVLQKIAQTVRDIAEDRKQQQLNE